MLTPVGLTLAAAGQAQDFYNQYQNLLKNETMMIQRLMNNLEAQE